MAVSQQIIDRKCYIQRIIISSFIYFLIWKECASLSDESFDTFVAKTIMEDPWLDVNISEDNTVTQAASTKPYAIQSPTLKYPSEEIEVADGELWPNEKNNDFPEGSLQKYSIIILQNNCSGMKDVLGNVSKAASVNDTDLTNIIEDCQTFATVRVSAQKSTEEAIAEIRKIFYNFKVVKIIQDVGKREEISLDLSSNFSDAGEMKNYYYIIGGIAIAFLIMIIVNFAVCSRKKRNNQSLDLSEIPHLTLATENFTMSIPRPTISPVHQGKTDDNMFSEYYQRGNCTKYSQGQVFENPEFKVKRSYLNPEDLRFDERMPKKKQVYSSSTEKDFLGNENATFCVKVVNY